MNLEEFKKTLPKTVPQEFTARYYGTRALRVFPKEFIDYVDACPQFIDVTAGGGRFTYDQARKSKPVGANDRCVYAACALHSVLMSGLYKADWFENLWELTYPPFQNLPSGYMSCLEGTFVDDRVRDYIDWLCRKFVSDRFVLYCIGKAIRSLFTFRGLSWCTVTPYGTPSGGVSRERFHQVVMKAAWTTYLYSQRVSSITVTSGYNQVLCDDALDAITYGFKDTLMMNALVYADPAWPWLNGTSSNPYRWVTTELSSILTQQKIGTSFWLKDENKIFTDVGKWIHGSLNRGARYFVICNQDTNFPTLERTHEFLASLTTAKLVKWIEVEDKSKAAHKAYRTAWGVLSC